MTTLEKPEIDQVRAEAFAGRLFGLYTSGLLTLIVAIGFRTGLFEAAARGPATSAGLAARAGLDERYVREWLGAVVTGGLFEYLPSDPLNPLYVSRKPSSRTHPDRTAAERAAGDAGTHGGGHAR